MTVRLKRGSTAPPEHTALPPPHSSPSAALPASSSAQKVQCTKIELNQKQIEERIARRKNHPAEYKTNNVERRMQSMRGEKETKSIQR